MASSMEYLSCNNHTDGSIVLNKAPVGMYSFVLIAALLAILVSVVMLILVLKSQSLNFNISLVSLSWTELVTGMVIFICTVVTMVHFGSCRRHWCSFGIFSVVFHFSNSSFHMLSLAVERVFATNLDVLHERHFCAKRLKLYSVIIWIISFIITLGVTWNHLALSTLGKHCQSQFTQNLYQTVPIVTFYVIGSFIPIIIYIIIAYKARVQERRIHVTSTLTYESYQAEVKVANSYLILSTIFTTFWMPLVVFCLLLHSQEIKVDLIIPIITLSVGLLSAPIRAVAICMTNQEIKQSFQKVMQCSSQR